MKNRLHLFLQSVHRRGQLFNLLMGLAVLCAWGILLFLACFAIDWLVRMPMPGRFILLALLLGISLRWAWRTGWRYVRSCSLTRCALQVEEHCKGLESLLISGVQFGQDREAAGTSVDLEELTIARADQAVVPLESAEVVPFKGLKKPSALAALGAVAIMVLVLINTPVLSAGLARIFTPWRAVSYPTRTRIDLDQADMVVREGGGLRIGVRLGGEVPGIARLTLRTGRGHPREHQLDVVDGACGYQIPAVFRSFEYAVMAGDAETDWQTVTVIPAPRVVGPRIRLVYPDYMQRAPEVMEAMSLTVPEGVHITWELRLDRPVRKAAFRMDGGVPAASKVSEDGFTVTHSATADASGAYAFAWTEKDYGFKFDSTTYYLQVSPDQRPHVELTRPARNIFATVGRELVLACRLRDDHGIGAAKVIYRQNNTDEQIVPLSLQATAGRSTRELDWDYRDAVKDLNVGDSVSFTLEVSDRYPNGPHRARSESRRVTFLSEEDYLQKVNERITRLLSRIRTIYRQERSAHVSLGELDPLGDAFRQRCFLESARQDMLTETVELLCTGLEDVVDDLRANGIEDEAQFRRIGMFRERLRSVSREQITKAAVQLRDLGAARDGGAEGLSQAAATVNHAARELGRLVALQGAAQAMEVMAMELHVIARMQNKLRIEAMEGAREAGDLSVEQEALAAWLDQFLKALESGVDYPKGPLKAVRLSRRIKDLRSAGIGDAMEQAADLLKGGQGRKAVDRQDAIVVNLLRLECAARAGAEHEALRRARDLLAGAVDTLAPAAPASEDTPADPLPVRLDGLRRKLQRLLLPDIPAPVADLLSESPPKVPPVETLTASGRQALKDAIRLSQAGNGPEARARQARAEEDFRALLAIVQTRLDEVTRADRYVGKAALAMDHSSRIGELLSGQMGLAERTENAASGEAGGARLAAAQLRLSKETLRIHKRIGGRQEGTEPTGRFVQPVRKLLKEAAAAMVKAHAALQGKTPGQAITHQDIAADALRHAIDLSNKECTCWTRVVNMISNAKATGVPAGYLADIAAEQHDFIEVTRRRPPGDKKHLLKVQVNLLRAMQMAVNLTGGIGTSPAFDAGVDEAKSSMTQSLKNIYEETLPGAADAQSQAVGSLRYLAGQLDDAIDRFDYFTTVLEFLRRRHSEGVSILSRLSELDAALTEEDTALPAMVKAAEALSRDAEVFAAQMVRATGKTQYAGAQAPLARAVAALKTGDRDACVKAISAARESLRQSMAELLDLGARIDYVRMFRSDKFRRLPPDGSPLEQSPPEWWVMLDMVTLLHRQRDLAHALSSADAAKRSDLVPRMRKLRDKAAGLVQSSANHRLVAQARARLIEAIGHVEKASYREAAEELHASNVLLRHCILEYALKYIPEPDPSQAGRLEGGKSTDIHDIRLPDIMLDALDKDWGGVEGEERRPGRTEWEVLGRRARAALNENFVRELPLEYREFLKDYYERLTE